MTKKTLLITPLLVLFSLVSKIDAQDLSGPIPEEVQSYLDFNYPGWQLAEYAPGIGENPEVYNRTFDLNFIKGDFNDSGSTDYALHIELPKSDPESRWPLRPMMVLLSNESGFERHIISKSGNIETFFWFYPAGRTVRCIDSDSTFTLKHDAISVNYFEKASDLKYYQNGEFRRIPTFD